MCCEAVMEDGIVDGPVAAVGGSTAAMCCEAVIEHGIVDGNVAAVGGSTAAICWRSAVEDGPVAAVAGSTAALLDGLLAARWTLSTVVHGPVVSASFVYVFWLLEFVVRAVALKLKVRRGCRCTRFPSLALNVHNVFPGAAVKIIFSFSTACFNNF